VWRNLEKARRSQNTNDRRSLLDAAKISRDDADRLIVGGKFSILAVKPPDDKKKKKKGGKKKGKGKKK